MVGMLGPHPNVKVEVCKSTRGGWLLYQQNPIHGWNDHLAVYPTRAEAEAEADRLNAKLHEEASQCE